MFGNGLLLEDKTLQRDVEASRCQAETPIYVGVKYLYSLFDLSLFRMQTLEIESLLAFVVCLSAFGSMMALHT